MARKAEDNVYTNVPATRRQNKALQRRSAVTVERAALVVLSVLLLASVSALTGVLSVSRPCQLKSGAKEEETKTISTSAGSVPPCVVQCDAGWELNGTKCYNFSPNRLKWTESRDMCQRLSADLVKIESREEQKFVFNQLIKGDRFWIGLTDSETEGQWKWTDGSPLDQSLTFWNMDPDNYDVINPEGEDCAIILLQPGHTEDRSWTDVSCSYPQRFTCEKEPTCK